MRRCWIDWNSVDRQGGKTQCQAFLMRRCKATIETYDGRKTCRKSLDHPNRHEAHLTNVVSVTWGQTHKEQENMQQCLVSKLHDGKEYICHKIYGHRGPHQASVNGKEYILTFEWQTIGRCLYHLRSLNLTLIDVRCIRLAGHVGPHTTWSDYWVVDYTDSSTSQAIHRKWLPSDDPWSITK